MGHPSKLVVGMAVLLAVALRPSAGAFLLDYGPDAGDSALDHCDSCCDQLNLTTPVTFFNGTYSEIFICSNGNVNFGRENTVSQTGDSFADMIGSQYVMITGFNADLTLDDKFMDIIDDYVDYEYHRELYINMFDYDCVSDDPADYPYNVRNCRAGMLEVFNRGKWGAVCDDSWGDFDAEVACRSMGFSAVHFWTTDDDYFWDAESQFRMDDVDCDGSELSLWDCEFSSPDADDCDEDEIVHIKCYNEEDYDLHQVDNEATIRFINSFSVVENLRPDLVGNIFYRNCRLEDLPAVQQVLAAAAGSEEVQVLHCAVATYYMVSTYSEQRADGVNAFQTIVASATVEGETKTGVVMAYELLQNIRKNDDYINAGFSDGQGHWLSLPGAMSPRLRDVVSLSNVDMPGVWGFVLEDVTGYDACPDPPLVLPPHAQPYAATPILILGYCDAVSDDLPITVNVIGSEESSNGIEAELSGSFVYFEMPEWPEAETVTLEIMINGTLVSPTIQYELCEECDEESAAAPALLGGVTQLMAMAAAVVIRSLVTVG